MPGSALLGLRYEPPFPYISDYGERGHTVLAGDFVSVEDGTGVVHTGAAFGEDDFRLAQDNGLTIQNPVRPDGTFDERAGPFAGMYVRDGRPGDHRGAARVGPPLPRRRVRALLPALLALRHAAHLLRQDQLVRAHHRGQGPAARRQRDDQVVPRPHQARALRQLAREQRGLGAVARALLGHRPADLALRRGSRGLRGLARRDRGARRGGARRPAPALHRRDRPALRLRQGHAPRARPDRRLVGLGLHALRPVARAVRERGRRSASASRPTTSARRSTRRAAGSTRCSASRRSSSGRAPIARCSASA